MRPTALVRLGAGAPRRGRDPAGAGPASPGRAPLQPRLGNQLLRTFRRGALAALVLCTASRAQDLLPNPGFEEGFSEDGIATGWADNSSWANLDVAYSPDTSGPHGGRACQRIRCTRLDYGAVQLIPQTWVRLARGRIYRVRGWLRGDVGNVSLQLRLAPAPYTVYVEKGLRVSAEWQLLEFLWTARTDDPEGRFMLRFVRPGTLWVDDLSVEELTPEQAAMSAPEPRPGNLLHNGGFDLGLANWLVSHGCDDWREASLSIHTHAGNPCLRVRVPEGVGVNVSSDVVPVAVGRPVRLSARVRSEPPCTVTFGSRNCRTQVAATATWQEAHAGGTVGFEPVVFDHVQFGIRGPTTVWIDDVVLRQDATRSVRKPFRAAVTSDRHPLALYHDGDSPVLTVLAAPGEDDQLPELHWEVKDFWGAERRAGSWRPTRGTLKRAIDLTGLGRGWYHATVRWDSDGELSGNECTFCVLPPPERRVEPSQSPFGAHFAVDPTGLRLAGAVGIRWLRLHPPNHTKWRIVEPEDGTWRWRDDPIRIAREAGLELVGSLDRCPDWASSAPPGTPKGGFYTGIGAWVPRDWTEWENYVARTVSRYKDRIHVWEVWNEPNLTSWLIPRDRQTRAQAYVEMLRHTTPVVRRCDPGATVVGGCVAGAMTDGSGAWTFAQDIISQGALELMDIFSFHDYITKPVDEGSEPIDAWLARLRTRMRAAGKVLPIINSEGGFSNPGTCLSSRPCDQNTVASPDMARWLVRQYVSQLALGVGRFFFYNFFVDGSPVVRQWQGFVEGDGQPRPNVAAYAAMTWLLDGAEFLRTERPAEDCWKHVFGTTRGRLSIYWARTDTRRHLPVGPAARVWDLMGAPKTTAPDGSLLVTDAPVYVLDGAD